MVAGACGPAQESYETGIFIAGPSVVQTAGLMPWYSSWLLGAARPDCAADVEVFVEKMDGTALDVPPGYFTAHATVECWTAPTAAVTYAMTLAQIDRWTLGGTLHIDRVPPCMDEQHRSNARALGQPFAAVTIQVGVEKNPSAAALDFPRVLYGVTTFRYAPFESWRSSPDAGTDADAAGARVTITSPADGAVVVNPVVFTVTATDDIATVQLKADDKYPVGDPFDPKVSSGPTKTFSRPGRRVIQALGRDATGKEIARHEISITIVEEVKVAPTYYHLVLESDYPTAPEQTLTAVGCGDLTVGGNPITISTAFFNAICIEGSGRLKDGTVINYVKDCESCTEATACPKLSSEAQARKKCFRVLDPSKHYDWGEGARAGGCPLVPLESWATDPTTIDSGTTIFAPDFAGKLVPTSGGVDGKTLDGCFRADDKGDAIEGYHVDIFAGSVAMERELQKIVRSTPPPYTPWMTVQLNHPKCERLRVP